MNVKQRNEQFLSFLSDMKITQEQFHTFPHSEQHALWRLGADMWPEPKTEKGCALCGKDHEAGPCWQFDYEINR